jgi:hypothetical protein
MKKWCLVSAAVVMCWLCGQQPANADTVATIGNPLIIATGTTVGVATFITDVAGQPAPFNAFIGSNTAGPNFSASWTFTFTLPTGETVTGASLTIGILDSPWEGPTAKSPTPKNTDQVASFTLDSTLNLTSILNTEINTVGTGLNKYEIDQITIPAADLSALASGSATFSLKLQGPGNGTLGLPTNFLGAGLGFSTLDIASQPSTVPPTPEPATWLLLSTGILGFGIARTLVKQP